MTGVEKMWKTIEKAEKEYQNKRCGRSMTMGEMRALADYSNMHRFEGITATFNLGFIRGARWAEKQRRKGMEVT